MPHHVARVLPDSLTKRLASFATGALVVSGLTVASFVAAAVVTPSPASAQVSIWRGDLSGSGCDTAVYTVPVGVHIVIMTAQGGNGTIGSPVDDGGYSPGVGGIGGRIQAQVSVTPGELLYVAPATSQFTAGSGESIPYGNGGLASAVSTVDPCTGTVPISGYVMVAGGGGGGGDAYDDTAGSGGAPGVPGFSFSDPPFGGQPGTTTAGGAPGQSVKFQGITDGVAGSFKTGGRGGTAMTRTGNFPVGGGGGGAGLYGGGGGGTGPDQGTGGGGGANYVDPSIPTSAPASLDVPGVISTATGSGGGAVVAITPVYTPTVTLTSVTNPAPLGTNSISLTVHITGYPTGSSIGTVALRNADTGATYDTQPVDDNGDATLTGPPRVSPDLVHLTASYTGGTDTDGFSGTVEPGTSAVLNQAYAATAIPVAVTASQVYGGAASFGYTTTPPSGGTSAGTVTCATADGGVALSALSVGSHALDPASCSGVTFGGTAALSVPSYSGTITVSKAALTTTVSGFQTFGGAPTFTHAESVPSGVSVSGSATCPKLSNNTTITSTLAVGDYTLGACTGLSLGGTLASNYTLTVTPASFSVFPATIYVKVTATRTFGGAPTFATVASQDQTFATTVLPAGLSLDGTVTCTQDTLEHTLVSSDPNNAENAGGTFTIAGSSCSGLSLSGPGASAYEFDYVGGKITVNPAPIFVVVSGASDGSSAPAYSYVFTNLPTGYSSGGTASCTTVDGGTAVTSGLATGNHTIDGASCSGVFVSGFVSNPASNWFLSYNGTLTVTTAPATVTGPSPTMTYGDPVPALLPSYSGVAVGALTSAAACTTTATSTSSPASYPVTCSGAVAPGYSFTYTAGSLTITKRPLTISAPSVDKDYGAAVPNLPAPTYGNFATGEGVVNLTTPPTCGTNADASSPVGPPIPVNCGGATSPNYTFTYNPGGVQVHPVPVTITAVASVTPDNHVTVTPTFDGLVNGDDASGSTVCSSTVNQNSNPGTYPGAATCHGFGNSNYVVTFVPASVTIRPTLTITAAQVIKKYGAPVPVTNPQYSGFVDGDNANSLDSKATCTSGDTVSSPAQSSSQIICSGASSAKYYIVYPGGTGVVVQKAPVVVTATADPVTYGTAAVVKPSYAGFMLGEGAEVLTTAPTCSSSAGTTPGTYTGAATCSGAAAANYAFSYVAGDVTVGKNSLTVTPADATGTYGSATSGTAPTYSGFLPGDNAANSVEVAPTCATNTTATTPAGVYPGTSSCSGGSSSKYDLVYAPGKVTIAKASLGVFAPSPSKVYGAVLPALTPTYNGFKNGEGAAALDTAPGCTTTADKHSSVLAAGYPVTCSGGVSTNYTFGYAGGTLTVTKAAAAITASNGQQVYGDNPPAITPTFDGLVNSDTPATAATTAPVCSPNTTASTPAGIYPGHATCSGAAGGNYSFSYVNGDVTVSARALTITASDASGIYGGAASAVTPGYDGFRPGDSAASLSHLPTCSSNTDAMTVPGSYAATSACSGAASANYAISYAKGTVTIAKAPLHVTAPSTTKVYGAGNPPLPAGYSGFVNGQGSSALETAPTCTTTALASSPVDSYPVTCSGGVSSRYALTYAAGSLSITKAPATITASDATAAYGDPVTITRGYAGLVNGDLALTALSTQPTCTSNTTATTAVGAYAAKATCSGAVARNYSFSYAAGTVTITPAPLAISPSAVSQVYGSTPPPVPTAQYAGFKNGQTATASGVLTHAAVCVSNVNATTPAGTYANKSICSGAVAPNYLVTFPAGTVTVTKAPVVITASAISKVWDSPGAVPAPSYAGFKNGQTAATAGVLTTAPTCVNGTTVLQNIGSYPSTTSCAGAVAANYAFTYVKGMATITKATLVTTVASISIKKSASNGKMTFIATVTNASGGLPAPGVPVTFTLKSLTTYKLTCTGITDATGTATCSNANGNLLLTLGGESFSATAPAAANYNATTGTGKLTVN
ncbi:MAG TPA: MBG domain-containing protein [Marmoricola sp.]|jgi:hypothetical protein|nr:MBG domain-containing protein [Marmoricola sp.]